VLRVAQDPDVPLVVDQVDIAACILGDFLRPNGGSLVWSFAVVFGVRIFRAA
jgi:hypothetical protein